MSRPAPFPDRSVGLTLMPVMAAVTAGFLVIGVALPVLPLHVHDELGFGAFVVGLVAGSQFVASLCSRVWAGSFADRHGARQGVMVGLAGASASGVLYLASLAFITTPVLSVAILLAGRALLGAAESFIIIGGVSWGMALVRDEHTGKVIAWVGTAMFLALAVGGPIGALLFSAASFLSIAILTAVLPVVVLVLLRRTSDVAPIGQGQAFTLGPIARAVWLPGLGAALSSIGYCAILAFGSLHYQQQNWQPIWLAFSGFAAALIVSRLLLGHLPDRMGGARTALAFLVVQSAGLLTIWMSGNALLATAGVVLAGFGYSLVYPGFGVEAIRDVRPEHRGLAMGFYTAFLDLAMGLGSPTLGLVAGHAGLGSVFLASGFVVLSASLIALRLMVRSKARSQPG